MTNLNTATVDLMHEFEGCRLKAYPDPATGNEPWTIGWGTTILPTGAKVVKGMTITQEQADEYFLQMADKFADGVEALLTRPRSDNQFGAMVSLAYNIGLGNFKKSSVLKKFNSGDSDGAANSFIAWNKAAGKVMTGLTRRRQAEAKLFGTPDGKTV